MQSKTTCWPAVRNVAARRDWFHPSAGAGLFSEAAWDAAARTLRLSGREIQVVQAVFKERTEFAIADDLGITPRTVHMHFERLYRKLKVTNRVGLVLRIMEECLPRTATAAEPPRPNQHPAPPADHARPGPGQAPADVFLDGSSNASFPDGG